MRKVLLFVLCCLIGATGLDAAVKGVISPEDGHGGRTVTLENSRIKAVFATLGGRLISLLDKKSGVDFVWNDGKGDSGALKDQLPPQVFDFRLAQYSAELLSNTPDQAVLLLKSPPTTGQWKFVRMSRTVTLRRDSSLLQCRLAVLNQAESMAPLTLTYWQHSFFGVPKQENRFFVPAESGVVSYVPSDANNRLFFKNPVRGWMAMLGSGGNGVVIMPEYRRLDMIYSWYCKASQPLDTVEWRYLPEKIAEGAELKSDFAIGVVNGLNGINGASAAGAGEIVLPKFVGTEPFKVQVGLTGFSAYSGTAVLRLDGRETGRLKCEIAPEKITRLDFAVPALKQGVYKLTCDYLGTDGKKLFDLLAALPVGTARGSVIFSEESPRNKSAVVSEKWQFDPSDKVVTQHCKWMDANNREVLFMLPANGLRDAVEMRQRMNIKIVAPTLFPDGWGMSWKVGTSFSLGSEKNGMEFLGEYLKKSYPAYVFGNEVIYSWDPQRVSFAAYPDNVRNTILDRVHAGAGLLLVNPKTLDAKLSRIAGKFSPMPDSLLRSMDLSAAPHFPAAEIKCGSYGKGRIVIVNFKTQSYLAPHGGPRFAELQPLNNDHRYQEYQFAVLCRLLNWSMGLEPEITAAKVTDGKLLLTATKGGKAEIELFDRYSRPNGKQTCQLKPGANSVPLSGLLNGKNYVHVKLNNDFAFAVTDVRTPERIRGINCAKSFKNGESVRGNVKLSNQARKSNCQVRTVITDNTGREVYAVNGADFVWDQKNAVVNRHVICAELTVDGKLRDRVCRDFYLPEKFDAAANFPNMLWSGGAEFPEYSLKHRMDVSRDFGFNFIYAGGAEAPFCNLMRLADVEVGANWHGPGMFHSNAGLEKWEKTHDIKYLERPVCPNNPAYSKPKLSAHLIFSDFGTRRIFQLGDEMSMTFYNSTWDVCFCKYCLADFAGELRKKYGTLDALNKEWRTAFKSWSEVKPMTRVEIIMHPSPAPWVEHRLYMDRLFARTLQKTRQALHDVYPRAIVGPTGVNHPPHPYGGNWNFAAMRDFDCASIYGTGRLPLSFNRDNRLIMQYRGYSRPEGENIYSFYEGIFSGERGSNNWYGKVFILPDLRESIIRQYYKDMLWKLRSGYGDLLYHSPKLVNQVAVLHSQNSLIANFIKQRKSDYYQKELSFAHALEDAGIAYRFITPEELSSGVLNDFSALILPESSAMSDAEVKAVRDFVSGGGKVIADYEPATLNGVCNVRDVAPLNDMFGIRAKRFALRKVLSHNLPSLEINQAGYGISCAGGKALYSVQTDKGNVPLVIAGKFGKGECVFLNFVHSYNAGRMHGKDQGFVRLLTELLGQKSYGKAVAGSTVVMHSYYANGKNLYIGLLPVPPRGEWRNMTLADFRKKTVNGKFTTATAGHLYSCDDGKYLGFGREFNIRLTPGEGSLLALLPYKVESIALDKAPATLKAGTVLDFSAQVRGDLGKTGHDVLLLTVTAPDGRERLCYRALVNTPDGNATFKVPFAINDPAGKWRLNVRSAASGVSAARTVELTR